ncbi:peroxisome biogenesis factor 10 [Austrofundulus limnaeus]|uniref:RING-type E3 ubiquitin transferase n=1 Tax=Austrofundulus limnaeus TaxID=52670 RepID=A0A2I4CJM3_AUSLI|nr:PREDICTED: peroxisome biogenesis factor 10 [Austrofundulus limnaeus]
MPLSPANQAQLIRSSQKDEYYRTFLKNRANEAFQNTAGSKHWLDWRREVELLSDLCYFSLTTLSGLQTLGEEYVNIVQVDPTGRRIPSLVRRGVLVLLHTALPYLLDKVLVCVENELEGEPQRGGARRQVGGWSLERWLRGRVQRAVGLLTEPQRRACQPAVLVVQQGVALLHRLHLALFYLHSSFYHLSKRTAGVRYLRVMGPSGVDDSSIRRSYLLLGVFSVLQLLVSVVLQVHSFRQRQRARQEWRVYRKLSPQHSVSSAPRCILCLEPRRNSTCTPCGHLFCWECITEWCNTKAECPLCREKFQPQRLVFLRNHS